MDLENDPWGKLKRFRTHLISLIRFISHSDLQHLKSFVTLKVACKQGKEPIASTHRGQPAAAELPHVAACSTPGSFLQYGHLSKFLLQIEISYLTDTQNSHTYTYIYSQLYTF